MNPLRFDVSFRIRHPNMDPEYICKMLGLEARHRWKAGANRKTPKGESLKGFYDMTYCSFRLQRPRNVSLPRLLKKFNGFLRKKKEFLESILSTGGSLEYYVGWYFEGDSGETFDLRLLSELLELGIDLSIEVHG